MCENYDMCKYKDTDLGIEKLDFNVKYHLFI